MPQCFGRCDSDGRFGILYECVTGESLLQYLLRTGDAEGTVKTMVALHRQLLQNTLPQALDIRQWLSRELGDEDLSALPDGNTLLHGDFHPYNIQIDGDKVWVLDWMNLCRGDKLYDIARTYCLLANAPLPPNTNETAASAMQHLRTQMAQAYLAGMGASLDDLAHWIAVIRKQM